MDNLNWLVKEIEKLKRNSPYPSARSLIMPALWIVEKHFPEILPEHMEVIAKILGVKPVEVEEIARFYAMFHTKKKGKYVVRVCTNLSCMLNGGESILQAICDHFGVKPGETTKDGLFTIEEAECMGLCNGAPAMTVNETRFTNLTPQKAIAVLEEFKRKENGKDNPQER